VLAEFPDARATLELRAGSDGSYWIPTVVLPDSRTFHGDAWWSGSGEPADFDRVIEWMRRESGVYESH
jgi:hypothetical protein